MVDDRAATYEAISSTAAWRVVRRDAVLVSGPGALDWLSGQVSQDVSGLGVPESPESPQGSQDPRGVSSRSRETLVLSPQGKVESFCRVTRVAADRFVLDVRDGFGSALYERLRRFKLRVKAQLDLLGSLASMEIRGPATPSVSELLSLAGAAALCVVDVEWPGWSGRDVLFAEGLPQMEYKDLALGARPGDSEAFDAARIEAGVPELGLELTDRTIPQEAGLLVAHAVSFSKGCYTGQELVARIDARGSNTPRRLRGVVVDALPGSAPAAGDLLVVGGDRVGELTSVAFSPGFGSYVALSYVKRAIEAPAAAEVVTGGAKARARIQPLPLAAR